MLTKEKCNEVENRILAGMHKVMGKKGVYISPHVWGIQRNPKTGVVKADSKECCALGCLTYSEKVKVKEIPDESYETEMFEYEIFSRYLEVPLSFVNGVTHGFDGLESREAIIGKGHKGNYKQGYRMGAKLRLAWLGMCEDTMRQERERRAPRENMSLINILPDEQSFLESIAEASRAQLEGCLVLHPEDQDSLRLAGFSGLRIETNRYVPTGYIVGWGLGGKSFIDSLKQCKSKPEETSAQTISS